MQTTTEILKALAPEFVGLEYDVNLFQLNVTLFTKIHALLDAHAAALDELKSLKATQAAAIKATLNVQLKVNARLKELKELAEREWQPIETAPMHQELLVYCAGDWVEVAHLEGGSDGLECWGGGIRHYPSHWMTLPAPPKEGV